MEKRKASILLAISAFLCAMSYMWRVILLIGRYHSNISHRYYIVYFTDITQLLLAPFCVMLGIALIIWTGRKANPVKIAIWGAAVLFLSLPTAIYHLRYIHLIISGNTPFSFVLLLFTVIVSFITGGASCLLALADFRRRVDVKTNDPRFIEKELRYLENLKRSGRIAIRDYERLRTEWLERL